MAYPVPPHGSGDHAQTVAQHYNQLEEAGLAQRTCSRIFYLRNFNNWIKSVLIAESLNNLRRSDQRRTISVLDLCSGKGGDLLKWKKGRIDHLVCADIAATSVEQSEVRYRQNVQRERNKIFSSEFIVADCTKERLKCKYKRPDQSFDLVSCQFSFHYCFESYSQAMMMLRNACECLRVGGYFIGTTPNANEIVALFFSDDRRPESCLDIRPIVVESICHSIQENLNPIISIFTSPTIGLDLLKRLRASKDNSFGSDVYRISFPHQDKENFSLFGAMYNFHLEGVVDCPEFLVYFPVLEKMAAQFGMKLVKKQTFAEFFKENLADRESLNLLSTMQALEPFPPLEGTDPASSRKEDYLIAKEFLSSVVNSQDNEQGGDRRRQSQRIGTLSLAEWEAATIYLVFVFQKVEDVLPPDDLLSS